MRDGAEFTMGLFAKLRLYPKNSVPQEGEKLAFRLQHRRSVSQVRPHVVDVCGRVAHVAAMSARRDEI